MDLKSCRWIPQSTSCGCTHHCAPFLWIWGIWVAPTLSTRSRLHHHISTLGYKWNYHWFSHLGHTLMPPGPSFCSYKRAWKVDLGSPLLSGGKTFWRRENCGRSLETFLLAKNLTGCQQVYPILHFLCHFQANHQEARFIHPSSYSRESLGIHLIGLDV